MAKINVKGTSITVYSEGDKDFISLTDIAHYKDSDHTDDLIRNCLRNPNTLEFLGIWEQLNNPDFNPVEFDGISRTEQLHSDAQTLDINRAAFPVIHGGFATIKSQAGFYPTNRWSR